MGTFGVPDSERAISGARSYELAGWVPREGANSAKQFVLISIGFGGLFFTLFFE